MTSENSPAGAGAPGMSQVEDPKKLGKAAEGAAQLSGRASALGKHPEEETQSAAKSLEGQNWGGQLGGALHFLRSQWIEQSEAQSGRCRQIGKQCNTTSQNFMKTESANTSAINSANANAIRQDFG